MSEGATDAPLKPTAPRPRRPGRPLPLLAGCQADRYRATKSERPVQVQRVVFASEDAAREFVGVVRARYETDLGFRVAGKIVARLVNVGDRVSAGDVVARLDPQDLKLQVESAEAELAAATSNLGQASRRLRALHHAQVARLRFDRGVRPQESGEGRSRRPPRARQARARSRSQPARLCRSQGRRGRRDHRDVGGSRPGRRHRAGGGAPRPPRREGSRGRAARDVARRGAQVARDGAAMVRSRPQLRGAAARALAAGRRRHPHLCRALHHRRAPTTASPSA